MIEIKQFIVFGKGKQRVFLLDVKSSLNTTWKEIISLTHISRAMFYNYLKESHHLNKITFDLLLTKVNLQLHDYSFKILTVENNNAEIPNIEREEFAEFIGILLGDGHLTKHKFQIAITMNSELEYEYVNSYLRKILEDMFKIKPYIRLLKSKRGVQIIFNSKIIHTFLGHKVGFPSGRRINNPENKIPDFIMQENYLLRACIRGLFDAEGSLSIRHHRAIRLSIYNNSVYLLDSIFSALKKLGFNPIRKSRSVRLNRTVEIKRFFNEIGTHNPYKLQRYNNWLETGKLDNVHAVVL